MTEQEIIKQLNKQVILPLFYNDDEQVCVDIVKTLYAASIRIVEFTNRGAKALDNFKKLVALRNETMPDMVLALGTIHSVNDAEQFLNAGADFLISPFFNKEICAYVKEKKSLWLPGCLTPTEVHEAVKNGFTTIKLFPGNVVGTSYVSTIKELFTNINIIVTGGVGVEKIELEKWLHAGADGLGFGSKLITKEIMQKKLYRKLQDDTIALLNNIQSIIKN